MQLGNIIKGLVIIAKHDGDDSYSVCAEHDEICAGPDLSPDVLPDDDVAALQQAGWHFNGNGWVAYI